jgi:hypothetical protein
MKKFYFSDFWISVEHEQDDYEVAVHNYPHPDEQQDDLPVYYGKTFREAILATCLAEHEKNVCIARYPASATEYGSTVEGYVYLFWAPARRKFAAEGEFSGEFSAEFNSMDVCIPMPSYWHKNAVDAIRSFIDGYREFDVYISLCYPGKTF